MASSTPNNRNASSADDNRAQEAPKGPHPGYVTTAKQYVFEQEIQRMKRENGCDPALEDKYRLLGVQLIDSIRQALQL
jgi:CTD kinase subunit beta